MSRLTDLADVLRAAGVPVVEVEGWQTRGRGGDGGQYQAGRPNHVMVHHTAGAQGASAASEVNYMVNVSDVAPVTNLYIARDKDNAAVWICAAGPTNTNGKGSAPWDPATKDDDMNRMAIGIELGNTGLGNEPYGVKQQETLIATCAALCEAYNIPVNHVRSHAEWSPGRKIDVAGPSQWAKSGTWPMEAFRETVAAAMGDPAPETPDRIKAEPGDGGWSLMRRLGMSPESVEQRAAFYDRNYIVYPDVWIYKP